MNRTGERWSAKSCGPKGQVRATLAERFNHSMARSPYSLASHSSLVTAFERQPTYFKRISQMFPVVSAYSHTI